MPRTWDIIVSTLRTCVTSNDVMVQLAVHRARQTRDENATSAAVSTTTGTQVLSTVGKPPKRGRSNELCSNPQCKRRGHTIEKCFREGGGKAGEWPDWWEGDRGSGPKPPSANSAITSTMGENVYAFSVNNNPISGGNKHELTSYADSGASEHCFVNRNDFTVYNPLATNMTGTTAQNGGVFQILGVGTVTKITLVNGIRKEITLTDVLHTPDLSHNLISIGRLDRKGCYVTFGGGGAAFKTSKGEQFMWGKFRGMGTMYEVELFNPPSALSARSQRKPTSTMGWHRRFGHAGEAGIRILKSKNLVLGLDIIEEEKEPEGVCEDCIFGKQTRRPFDTDVTPETEILERVHMDLWGPARVESTGGKKYLMLAVDGASSHSEGYFLENKKAETTLSAMKHYHAMAERQTGKKLKKIRTDGGGEWVSEKWEAWTAEHGIIHETTAPYSSSANGVPERGNRTFLERARSMMHDAKIPSKFWAETIATAVYLKDFLPTARHPEKVPYELWTGVKPDVSHLRAFGCAAYAKIPAEEGGSKIEDRSIKTTLLGYFGRGAYRLLDRATGKIFKSRDVIFDEGTGHRTPGSNTEGDYDFSQIDDNLPLPIFPELAPTPVIKPEPIEAKVPIENRDNPGDLDHRAHGLAPAHDILPSAPPTANLPPPPDIPHPSTEATNPGPRRSGRLAQAAEKRAAIANVNSVAVTDETMRNIMIFMVELDNAAAMLVNPEDNWIPRTYTEAMTRPDLWKEPMDAEMERMKQHEVWTLVDAPEGDKTHTMKNRWVFANKYDANGIISGRKARLVAKGFTQIPGVEYFETYASVVRYESLRMNFALAAAEGMVAWIVDYISAYLNAANQAVTYMVQPEGYVVKGKEKMVCAVVKALYGTMDGGYNWWKAHDEDMKEKGFYRSQADPSVRSRNVNGEITITSTYTDDVNGLSSTVEGGILARKEMGYKYDVKDLGEASSILGIRITRDWDAGTISLDQRPYFERVLARYGMTDCRPHYTPLPPGMIISKADSPTTEGEQLAMAQYPYRECLGSIMYGQIATRPDLSFAVSSLSKVSANPGMVHWKALMHVLGYIKGTLHYRILYGGKGFTSITPYGYVDSDFAACPDTRRSCSGHVFIQAGGPTAWGAQYQPTVALSTTEAEYMSLTRSARQILWMYSGMSEIGFEQPKPAMLYGDNAGSIALTKNTKGNSRVKHIDIRHHYIRERVEEGDIAVEYVPTEDNIADLFTKSLGRVAHHKHCLALRLCDD